VARVSTYLNFPGNTEEALNFYRGLFGTEFVGPFARFKDMGVPGLSEDESNKIMHAEIEISNGHVLMATDMLASQGHHCRVGNNTTIMVELDSEAEVDRLYGALAQDSTEFQAPAPQPWGQYWSTCLDRFGIRWMLASGDVTA
jgi:PhnB protein